MTTDEEKLIMDNLNLAYDLAWKYFNKCGKLIEFEELKSISLLGLTKAAKTFNLKFTISFSTYAYKVICNEILMFIRQNQQYFKPDISLDKGINTVNSTKLLYDILPDENNVINELENQLEIEYMNKMILELPDRLQNIIKYYLDGYTMIEIGKLLNISQPQVSRDYHKALNILRYKFEERK